MKHYFLHIRSLNISFEYNIDVILGLVFDRSCDLIRFYSPAGGRLYQTAKAPKADCDFRSDGDVILDATAACNCFFFVLDNCRWDNIL